MSAYSAVMCVLAVLNGATAGALWGQYGAWDHLAWLNIATATLLLVTAVVDG